jgi:hypothetical protein
VAAPKKLTAVGKAPKSVSIESLGLLPAINWAATMRKTWIPGEAGAAGNARRRVVLADDGEVGVGCQPIRKKNYEIFGGHKAMGFSILEDVQMAKKLTERSLGGIIPVLASRDISVRMYSNWKTMVAGFSKNLVLIYGGNPLNFVILLAMINFIFFYPLWGLFVAPTFAATALAAILILRLGIGLAFGNSFWPTVKQLILFWPSLLALNYFSFQVLKNISEKKTDWKGRKIYLPENLL